MAKKSEDDEKLPYGVPELAEVLDIQQAMVRVKLRNKDVKKNGSAYGWKTKSEFQEVVDKLKAKPKSKKSKKNKAPDKKAA